MQFRLDMYRQFGTVGVAATRRYPLSTDKHIRTREVGQGADGAEYGVTRFFAEKSPSGKSVTRRKPCRTCPWRKDAEIGRFPAEAYRTSANTAYDGSMNTFACHESGSERSATCAGFLLANSAHNIAVRLGHAMGTLEMEQVRNPDGVELYESYREMAIANGVSPEDPRIAACRGDEEDGLSVYERVKTTGAFRPRSHEDFVRYMHDEAETDL